LIFAPLTSAQGQQGCDGVIVLDRSISHFEASAKHLIGIKIVLHNSNATDVYDVQVRVDFTGARGDYSPVLFTVDAIPAKNYAEIETFASYYTQPERYEVTVVGCRTGVVDPLSWLNLLHAPDSALQQVAVDASEDMTAADVPDLIAALDQHAAGNDEEAERELIEDLVLIGTLARLGDPRAVPAFLDAVAWVVLGIGSMLHWTGVPTILWWSVFVGVLAGVYTFYRLAVTAATSLAESVMSAFDLYRGELCKQYRITAPSTADAESAAWRRLGFFIALGDRRFYPPLASTHPQKPQTPGDS